MSGRYEVWVPSSQSPPPFALVVGGGGGNETPKVIKKVFYSGTRYLHKKERPSGPLVYSSFPDHSSRFGIRSIYDHYNKNLKINLCLTEISVYHLLLRGDN